MPMSFTFINLVKNQTKLMRFGEEAAWVCGGVIIFVVVVVFVSFLMLNILEFNLQNKTEFIYRYEIKTKKKCWI